MSASTRFVRIGTVVVLAAALLAVPRPGEAADDPASVNLRATAVAEGDAGTTTITFVLSVSGSFDGTIEGTFETVGAGQSAPPGKDPATAESGIDYEPTSGTFSFDSSGDYQAIPVSINGDTDIEPDEFFYLTVASDRIEGGLATQGRIINDDRRELSIGDSTVIEGSGGDTIAEFTVTMSHVSSETVTVEYVTCGLRCDPAATADEFTDFQNVWDSISLAPGTTTQTIPITIYADIALEADETFFVILTNPVGAAKGDNVGLGTILNDDTQIIPDVTIDDVAVAEGDGGGTRATFTVTLSPAPTIPAAVEYTGCGIGCKTDATAEPGVDFERFFDTLIFQPGQTSQTVDIMIIGDTDPEADEFFYVYLVNPVDAIIVDSFGRATILDDDTPGRPPVCNGQRATIWGDGLLVGTSGDDIMVGGPGADELRGNGGDDSLCGRGGDDFLVGGPGNDAMFGEGGDDLIKGLQGNDSGHGGDGDDRLQGNSGVDVLEGGDGKDKLWGGIDPDDLSGGAGNDQLRGGRDDDSLDGGSGTDRIWGDAGDDEVRGGTRSDFLYGGIGADTLRGGHGNDRIFGWTGDDSLYGEAGRDQLRGQGGDDLVDGGVNYDYCGTETIWLNCEKAI